jgi:hypothetical protein
VGLMLLSHATRRIMILGLIARMRLTSHIDSMVTAKLWDRLPSSSASSLALFLVGRLTAIAVQRPGFDSDLCSIPRRH